MIWEKNLRGYELDSYFLIFDIKIICDTIMQHKCYVSKTRGHEKF